MEQDPTPPDEAQGPPPAGVDPEAWKSVVLGQASRDLVPQHPEPGETPDDELTRSALEDPGVEPIGEEDAHPTLWRLVILLLVAVGALSVVFGFAR